MKNGDSVRHEVHGDGVLFAFDQYDSNIAIVDFDDDGLIHVMANELEEVHPQ